MSRKISLDERKALCFGYDIQDSTLRTWNSKLLLNRNWLPLHIRTLASDNQFSESEEIVIAEMIRSEIEQNNIPLDNDIVKKAATIFFYDTHEIKEKENINYIIQLNASSHLITKFKRKHKFSRRKFRRKRRSSISLSKVITFFKQLQKILNTAEF
ncbi:hypothetical protein M9Y10_008408 [Tritrichomonas musculus]|uniref:Uncharacterized protein n=1 Tax=Tritrichomonas musculus TaxID=1915356 RepID=A0ABR2IZ48_9EUKA